MDDKTQKISDLPRRLAAALALAVFLVCSYSACENGVVGGADETETDKPVNLPADLPGVWYSYYGEERLDGYHIGLIKNLAGDLASKLPVDFPNYKRSLKDGYTIKDTDYYIYYDDLGGYGGTRYGFLGVVRAVNLFPDSAGNKAAGAVIFEYMNGCYPNWTDLSKKPFMAVYYRIIDHNHIQMANPIDLAKLADYNEDESLGTAVYAVETATLNEAVNKFTAAKDQEYINWGVVISQTRNK
ncbi:MAG: hypothetical protein LBB22_01760 [Treponema sp.]|jgi:hypothetical protein|nr:hypothetical protein [Treponema sp.]